MNIQSAKCGLGILVISMLGACAPFGKQSPLETPTAYSLPQGQSARIANAQWWTQLKDPQLNRLISQALAASPNLRMVRARFEQAQAQLGITESAAKTQLGLAVNGIGTYVSHKPSAQDLDTNHTLAIASAALQGSWSFDFWGKNRAQVASVLGRRQALAYEAEQTQLELANAVAAQYFAWQSLAAQQQLLAQRLSDAAETEKILKQRIRANLLPASASYPAEMAQQQIQAQQLQLERNMARVRHSLAVLSGQAPNALDRQMPAALAVAPSLRAADIRADLLGRRPDIAAQRALLTSRSQNIEAAKAEFYPNIELKLLAGLSSIDAFGVIRSGHSGMLGIVPAVSLPIFTSGALQSRLALRNAEYNEQVAVYDQTVLNAMRAAADAVSDYQTLQGQALMQQRAAAISEKTARSTQRRVGAGLENKLAYLQKQDEALQLKMQAAQAQGDLLTAWSNLHAQLGGGFRVE
ncbi:MAG: efflux transporter outer membrane subunit [Neisseria sp.]|nr:efflux transporter outer membrane subunit [Neisseria sp.]